ncbi:MAG: transglycosylase domain-containing protein [Clostridia bacterium]|nr:transglycosylase domain-containing protein [Clostridia bacterium]
MKYLVRFLTVLILLGFFFVGQVFVQGFQRYQAINHENHLMDVIETYQSSPNYVTLDEIPKMLIQSTVAIEDKRFYNHIGFDIKSTARAFVMNTISGEIVSGGSTITQQLAKNLYLTFEKTYERKVTELLLALTLEEKLSKDEILELYLNIINYGENQMGIYNASKHYFNKLPSELTEGESIILAGLPQSPNYYSLTENIEKAYRRADQVISALVSDQVLSYELIPLYETIIRQVRTN